MTGLKPLGGFQSALPVVAVVCAVGGASTRWQRSPETSACTVAR